MGEGKPMSLLVRNLRYATSPDRVREFFEKFGEVRDVYLPLEYYSKLPRGFGFVEFSHEEDAQHALNDLSRTTYLDGAQISVTIAQQGRKSPDSMRHREKVNRGHRRGDSDGRHDSGPRRRHYRSPSFYGSSGSYDRYRSSGKVSHSKSRGMRKHYSRYRSYSQGRYYESPSIRRRRRRSRKSISYEGRRRRRFSRSYDRQIHPKENYSKNSHRYRGESCHLSEKRSISRSRAKSFSREKFDESLSNHSKSYNKEHRCGGSERSRSFSVASSKKYRESSDKDRFPSESESPERRVHNVDDEIDESNMSNERITPDKI